MDSNKAENLSISSTKDSIIGLNRLLRQNLKIAFEVFYV